MPKIGSIRVDGKINPASARSRVAANLTAILRLEIRFHALT
jgi:hypothetical protein